MHENERGIRKPLGEKPRSLHQSRVTGISAATIGVLLRNALKQKVNDIKRNSPPLSDVLRPNTRLATLSSSWHFSTPARH
jgi:hypothetical protein